MKSSSVGPSMKILILSVAITCVSAAPVENNAMQKKGDYYYTAKDYGVFATPTAQSAISYVTNYYTAPSILWAQNNGYVATPTAHTAIRYVTNYYTAPSILWEQNKHHHPRPTGYPREGCRDNDWDDERCRAEYIDSSPVKIQGNIGNVVTDKQVNLYDVKIGVNNVVGNKLVNVDSTNNEYKYTNINNNIKQGGPGSNNNVLQGDNSSINQKNIENNKVINQDIDNSYNSNNYKYNDVKVNNHQSNDYKKNEYTENNINNNDYKANSYNNEDYRVNNYNENEYKGHGHRDNEYGYDY
ncbi:hypothetical protein AYI68_g7653 [Smittium mucronatum]|uniref:Uncharacterized protein n=1 Tax=Smittium mucronatum TaxID=133383 RepID=A0A1R0GN26_9FUNG|nr:hypothetical protein AYI68_g7653 [Smittium mucronatum]